MYVLDGETIFFISSAIVSFMSVGRNQQIPQMIVVGIPNVDRNRDFTPTVGRQMLNPRGADNFIEFLDKELIKYIDDNFRTQDYRILFGHSLCGLFSAYTLVTNPNLFHAHIAASPGLMFEDEYVINKAKEVLYGKSDLNNQIYIAIGDEPAFMESMDKFTYILEKDTPGINWEFQKYDNEDHDSVPFRTIADGLAFIFSDMQLTGDIALKGVDAIKEHIKDSYKKYGFNTEISEVILNRIGYQLLQANENEKAIEIFEYNVELYPNSANVYDSLGDAYDKQGLKNKAINSYKKAVFIGEKTKDVNLQAYRNNVERLKNQ